MDKNSLQRPIQVGYGQETEMNPMSPRNQRRREELNSEG